MNAIPFNAPSIVGNELDYVRQAVQSGIISGEGEFGKKCERKLSELLGGSCDVLLTPSCTSALEMAALLLNLNEGDEVIMPSFTFVSTATAFALRGAKPVFADVDPKNLNIDPSSIESKISPKTKAIVVVHYAGVACQMEEIHRIAVKAGVPVIEDAAHALGSTFNDKALGTYSSLATLSFHETKNITCGEGGALIVNDKNFLSRAEILRDKGTNRQAFFRHSVASYTWVDIGSSYRISDMLSAFLYAQLEKFEIITERRRTLHRNYFDQLSELKQRDEVEMQPDAGQANSNGHLFFLLLKSHRQREGLREFLASKKIHAVFHYQPLHLSSYVKERWGQEETLPVTEDIANRLLRLPMYYSLSDNQQQTIINSVHEFFRVR